MQSCPAVKCQVSLLHLAEAWFSLCADTQTSVTHTAFWPPINTPPLVRSVGWTTAKAFPHSSDIRHPISSLQAGMGWGQMVTQEQQILLSASDLRPRSAGCGLLLERGNMLCFSLASLAMRPHQALSLLSFPNYWQGEAEKHLGFPESFATPLFFFFFEIKQLQHWCLAVQMMRSSWTIFSKASLRLRTLQLPCESQAAAFLTNRSFSALLFQTLQSTVDTHNKYTHGLYSYEWEHGWEDVSACISNRSEVEVRNMGKAAKQQSN